MFKAYNRDILYKNKDFRTKMQPWFKLFVKFLYFVRPTGLKTENIYLGSLLFLWLLLFRSVSVKIP